MVGSPLIYLGDEIGTLNDYTYRMIPPTRVTAAGYIVPARIGRNIKNGTTPIPLKDESIEG
jgi:hypothetical protein